MADGKVGLTPFPPRTLIPEHIESQSHEIAKNDPTYESQSQSAGVGIDPAGNGINSGSAVAAERYQDTEPQPLFVFLTGGCHCPAGDPCGAGCSEQSTVDTESSRRRPNHCRPTSGEEVSSADNRAGSTIADHSATSSGRRAQS